MSSEYYIWSNICSCLPNFFATALSCFASMRPTPISSSSNSSRTWAASWKANTQDVFLIYQFTVGNTCACVSVSHVLYSFLTKLCLHLCHYHKSLLFIALLMHFLNLYETWTSWLTVGSTNGRGALTARLHRGRGLSSVCLCSPGHREIFYSCFYWKNSLTNQIILCISVAFTGAALSSC